MRQKAIDDNMDKDSGLLHRCLDQGETLKRKRGSNNGNNVVLGTGNNTNGSCNTRNKTSYYCREPIYFKAICSELKNKSQTTIVESK